MRRRFGIDELARLWGAAPAILVAAGLVFSPAGRTGAYEPASGPRLDAPGPALTLSPADGLHPDAIPADPSEAGLASPDADQPEPDEAADSILDDPVGETPEEPDEPAIEEPAEETPEEPGVSATDDPADPDAEAMPAEPQNALEAEVESDPQADPEPELETEPEPEMLEPAGNPLAAGIIDLLDDEMTGAMARRGVMGNYQRFRSYAAMKLNTTAQGRGGEVTGNCRLKWYDHLLRRPEAAPAEAEQFTRELHEALRGDHRGLDRALVLAREKMDLPGREPREFEPVTSPEQALAAVGTAVTGARLGMAKALATLHRSEIGELDRNLYPVLVSQNRLGHTLQNRGMGRRLCDLLEKMDRSGIYDAVEAIVPLADPGLLAQLAGIQGEADAGRTAVPGVSGSVIRTVTTPSGTIVVGGPDANTYNLEIMQDVAAVIDLGGNDSYNDGSVSFSRPVLVLIDLGGDDRYEGTRPGVQASAILGVSAILDVAGDDVYRAKDMAQASALAGAGLLIDYAGNDNYLGIRRVQGQAFGGFGLLLDRGGNDRYHGALWTQGMGGPLGFAVLDDLDGSDTYYTGGLYYDDYEETPGYDGWGQGVGAGPRSVACGGIGVILDGGGDDTYEFDYLAHGGGYWMGLGFARDFGGNDQRLGATRTTYSGGRRTEQRFQRFGSGFGCHYALGFCFDDLGDDVYHGSIMGLGHGWDCSLGALCDFDGNDRYESTGGLTQGCGHQASVGILYDYAGNDYYRGYSQGSAPSGITYHDMPQCGGNFSFVVDYGGTDTYGCGARNNSYNQRTTSGGFLIDRPSREEAGQTASRAAGASARRTASRRSAGS